ncbi:hypothetical protein SAMN05428984_2622 [Sphingomonas sp. OK281]|nr:hypothetical protein SAMN05428984_2622 [Sphingomonas sp. OK281]
MDVALFIDKDVPKNRFANRRTAAGIALAEGFSDVEPHMCKVDEGDSNHPFERIGVDCVNSELPGPWQGKTVHLSDDATIETSNLTEGFSNVFETTNLPVPQLGSDQ